MLDAFGSQTHLPTINHDWMANDNQEDFVSLPIPSVIGKGASANYWLDRVYPETISRAHRDGSIHIHDLDRLSGHCTGWSLRELLTEGLTDITGKITTKPPGHLSTAIGQMAAFLDVTQNEWAGTQTFSSLDTYLAPYVRKDGLSYKDVLQNIKELIFRLNVSSYWNGRPPSINVTFDWVCPEDLRETSPIISGKKMSFCYGDLQPEMDAINRAYIETMSEGDAGGRAFTFPITTYNITRDFDFNSENAALLFEMAARQGVPYFQNFINSEMEPSQIRAMSRRLHPNLRELFKRGNGLFGSAEQAGSVGLVTVNCARLGHQYAMDINGLYARLDRIVELARDSLEIKRRVINGHMDGGRHPYMKRYLGSLRNHFSTIGVNGINEMILNFTHGCDDITSPSGKRMAGHMLTHIRNRLVEFQKKTGHLYNLEATSEEKVGHRFAGEDIKKYPSIIHAGTAKEPNYTNSSQIPVKLMGNPLETLKHQDDLQIKYNGGTVLRLPLGNSDEPATACRELVERAIGNFKISCIAITPTILIGGDE